MFDPSPTPHRCRRPRVREAALPTPTAQLVRAVREGVQGGLARVQAVADLVRNPAARSRAGLAADASASWAAWRCPTFPPRPSTAT